MDLDRYKLADTYKQLSDAQIRNIAYYEAETLVPEAFKILCIELRRRATIPNYEEIFKSVQNGIEEKEIQHLINLISEQPCPHCRDTDVLLNANEVIRSTRYYQKYGHGRLGRLARSLIIGCSDCLVANAKKALWAIYLSSLFTIIRQPITTINAIVTNHRGTNPDRYKRPTQEYFEFVKNNVIPLTINKGHPEAIRELISDPVFPNYDDWLARL